MRIAFFGQRGHGKTTAAKLIQKLWYEHTANHTDIYSFSDPLKYALSILSGMTYDELMRTKDKVPVGWKQTPREGMKQLSDLIKSVVNDKIFITLLLNRNITFIVDDGRYASEAKALQDSRCFNVLIYRPDKVNEDQHSSESWLLECYKRIPHYRKELNLFDFILINNGSLDDLKEKLHSSLLPHYSQWVKDVTS